MPDFAREAYASAGRGTARSWRASRRCRAAARAGAAAGAGAAVADHGPARRQMAAFAGLPAGRHHARDRSRRARATAVDHRAISATFSNAAVRRSRSTMCWRSTASRRWRSLARRPRRRFRPLPGDRRRSRCSARIGRIALPLMSVRRLSRHRSRRCSRAGVFDPVTATVRGASMPTAITEDVAHAWMRDTALRPAEADTAPDADKPAGYSWCKAPRLDGRPVEVGALARQAVDGDPLIRDLLARSGPNVANRVIARLLETAQAGPRDAGLGAPARSARAVSRPRGAARRGRRHWPGRSRARQPRPLDRTRATTRSAAIRSSRRPPGISRRAIATASPVRWSRRWSAPKVGDDGAASVAVQHVVRSFDPCMVCTAH